MAFTALPLTAGEFYLKAGGALNELVDAVQERWEAVFGETYTDLSAPVAGEYWLKDATVDTLMEIQRSVDILRQYFVDDTTYFKTAGSVTGPTSINDIESNSWEAWDEVFNTLTYSDVLSQAGFTRKYRNGSGALQTTTGLMQVGDLVGMWLINELHTMLEAMTVSKVNHSRRAIEFSVKQDYIYEPSEVQAIWRAKTPASGGDGYKGVGADAVAATAQDDASTDFSDQSPITGIDFIERVYYIEDQPTNNSEYGFAWLSFNEVISVEEQFGAKEFSVVKLSTEANWYNDQVPTHRTRTIRGYALPIAPLRVGVSGYNEAEFFVSATYTKHDPHLISTTTGATASFAFGSASTEPPDATNIPDNNPATPDFDDPEQFHEGVQFLPIGVVVWNFNNV